MKKITALILAALLAVCSLSACENANEPDEPAVQEGETTVSDEETAGPEGDSEEDAVKDESGFSEELSTVKIGELAHEVAYLYSSQGGIYYKSTDGKYGVMTFDAKKDTGAVYEKAESCGLYFAVSEKENGESLEVDDLNITGLVDAEGNEILPYEYFMIKSLNDRFVKTYKATERTEDESEAMVYISTSGWYTSSPGEEDPMYKAEWKVYDTVEGEFVEGVIGNTKEYSGYTAKANGNYITYYDSSLNAVTVDAKGNEIGSDITLLDDGSTLQPIDGKGVVFSPDGVKLFTYELDGYVPYEFSGDYYMARKIADGVADYAVLNREGEMVLDVPDDYGTFPESYGDIIVWSRTAYDLDGNVIMENCYDVEYSQGPRNAIMLESEDKIMIVKYDGTEIFSTDVTDDLYYEKLNVCKGNDGDEYFYSHKDGDYTIEAHKYSSVSPWLVEIDKSNAVYDLLDTYSGEVILKNYKDYEYKMGTDGEYMIYALNASGIYEVWEIK